MKDLFWRRLAILAFLGLAAAPILILDRAVAARQHGPGFILAMLTLVAAVISTWPTRSAAKNGS